MWGHAIMACIPEKSLYYLRVDIPQSHLEGLGLIWVCNEYKLPEIMT